MLLRLGAPSPISSPIRYHTFGASLKNKNEETRSSRGALNYYCIHGIRMNWFRSAPYAKAPQQCIRPGTDWALTSVLKKRILVSLQMELLFSAVLSVHSAVSPFLLSNQRFNVHSHLMNILTIFPVISILVRMLICQWSRTNLRAFSPRISRDRASIFSLAPYVTLQQSWRRWNSDQ